MSALTLPGSIPGLLRRGSPVLGQNGERGTVLEPTGHAALGDGFRVWHYAGMTAGFATPRQVGLDLTDATGLAHAAWWLSEHAEWPSYGYRRLLMAGEGFCAHAERAGRREGVRFLIWASPDAWLDAGSGLSPERVVPSLADLDPDDPRLLPDGSRWVDAEALRRVVLHVAGVSP